MTGLATAVEQISLPYEVDPGMVCGGVRVDETGIFMPVLPGDECVVDDKTSLWEYVDTDGNIRACLMRVRPGGESPAWEILEEAALSGYYEEQRTVEGDGTFVRWRLVDSELQRTETRLPENGLTERHMRVEPGDVFMVRAGKAGAHVVALFSGAPFHPAFERCVAIPVAAG